MSEPQQGPALEAPQGRFPLALPHASPRSPLRAWDAADQYLLRVMAERPELSDELTAGAELWIFDDPYGALSIPLLSAFPSLRVTVYVDLTPAAGWIRDNIRRCLQGAPEEQAALCARLTITSLPSAERAPPQRAPTAALVKVGTQLSHLCRTLDYLSTRLPTAWLLAGGMCKHIHTSTLQAFEERVGPSPTSLAWRKARLIRPSLPQATEPRAALSNVSTYRLDQGALNSLTTAPRSYLSSLELLNSRGTFAEGQLDQGARAMLPFVSQALSEACEARATAGREVKAEDPLRVADLGCGDGVLSWVLLAAALAVDVPVELSCLDISSAAIESASLTLARWVSRSSAPELRLQSERVTFLEGDALEPWRAQRASAQGQLDLILNNPPFHQRGATTSGISERMFEEASRALSERGALWVVGNRHLGYHQHLKRHFSSVKVESKHPKFVVIRASMPTKRLSSSRALDSNKGPRRGRR